MTFSIGGSNTETFGGARAELVKGGNSEVTGAAKSETVGVYMVKAKQSYGVDAKAAIGLNIAGAGRAFWGVTRRSINVQATSTLGSVMPPRTVSACCARAPATPPMDA